MDFPCDGHAKAEPRLRVARSLTKCCQDSRRGESPILFPQVARGLAPVGVDTRSIPVPSSDGARRVRPRGPGTSPDPDIAGVPSLDVKHLERRRPHPKQEQGVIRHHGGVHP